MGRVSSTTGVTGVPLVRVRLNGGMADAQLTEVRRLIDGLRRNPRTHPYHGRREYSDRAREVAAALAGMIEAGHAADADRKSVV